VTGEHMDSFIGKSFTSSKKKDISNNSLAKTDTDIISILDDDRIDYIS